MLKIYIYTFCIHSNFLEFLFLNFLRLYIYIYIYIKCNCCLRTILLSLEVEKVSQNFKKEIMKLVGITNTGKICISHPLSYFFTSLSLIF